MYKTREGMSIKERVRRLVASHRFKQARMGFLLKENSVKAVPGFSCMAGDGEGCCVEEMMVITFCGRRDDCEGVA